MTNYPLIHHRQLSATQLSDVANLESQLFDDAWSITDIEQMLQSFGGGVVLCQSGETLLGYCLYQVVFETAEVLRIGTNPTYQQQGIGLSVLQSTIEFAKDNHATQILLEVRADNTPAIALYHKCGFGELSKRVGYYQGVDALILQKVLSDVHQ